MYVDPLIFHTFYALAHVGPLMMIVAGVALLRSRRVGGLTFVRIGRVGASFYIARRNAR
jgi:hypothetical protein